MIGNYRSVATSGTQRLGFRFETALLYASRLHAEQRRKGKDAPYIAHLLGVASLVLEADGDEDQTIAALLHDALEDIDPRLRASIAELYGERVAHIVEACTDTLDNTEARGIENWKERKQHTITFVKGTTETDVLLVMLCDKLYNARAIALDYRQDQNVFERFNGKKEQTFWYYDELVKAFRTALTGSTFSYLVEEFEQAVAQMKSVDGDPANAQHASN